MSDDKKQNGSLTDEDMITSPKLSRRVLLATAGVALGAATLGAQGAFAAEDKDAVEADDGQDAAEKDTSGADHAEGDKEEKDPDDQDASEKDDGDASEEPAEEADAD